MGEFGHGLVSSSLSARKTRKGALLGAAAFSLALFASSGAQAQNCSSTGALGAFSSSLGLSGEVGAVTGTANALLSVLNTMNTAFLAQGSAFVGSPPSPLADQTAGGVWIRGIGGELETKSTGTLSNMSVNFHSFPAPSGPIPGTISCDTKVRQDFGGVQAGVDIARLNLGSSGQNVHFGVTAGYGESRARDLTFGGSGDFQVPFVGAYSVFTWGNFFFDTLTRWDFYQMTLNNSNINVNNQHLDARGIDFTASAGYRVDLGNNWFLEPSAGIIHSVTKVDTLNVSGTIPQGFPPGGLAPPTFVQFEDVTSTLGRAGVRVGTSFATGDVALQPFVAASIWHEFEGPVNVRFQSNCAALSPNLPFAKCASAFPVSPGFIPDFTGTLSSTRVGTYGQYSAGVAAQIVNTGWLGYIRVDFRDGPNIEGVSVNGGIRYQFNPEVPVKPAGIYKAPVYKAPVLAAPYNWTGFYLGGFLGTAWGETRWFYPDSLTETFPRFAGILGGGQIGFNYQVGSWVFGLEGDLGWTNEHGSQACPNGFFFTCTNNHVDPLATATARVGYAWNRALFYVKGGGAWTRDDYLVTCNDSSGLICNVQSESFGDTRAGWTVGAGLEFGLTPNWSAKVEYDYLDFGSRNFTEPDGTHVQIRESVNEVKVGVNYRFGGSPIVAKY
jgi:opacity protein-like surface antigen